MEEAIGFFRAFETWIYLLLGLVGLYYIRRFFRAWQELRSASFGLERESAQARLNQAASILVLLLTMVVTEFVLVSFIAPTMPGPIGLPSPTLNLMATPSATLPAEALSSGEPLTTEIPAAVPTVGSSGCEPGQREIVIPENGEEISGVVPVVGSANIPNFGFYKFEIKRPEEATWLTIQAGNSPVSGGKLGDWDTSRLSPGDYQLALIVVDNQAKPSTPCIIQVRVALPPALTPGP
jgi:hypothetical protein